MINFLLWLLLAVVSLPLALFALILYPIIWLVSLPFRLVGVSLKAVFEFIGALIKLPARVLDCGGSRTVGLTAELSVRLRSARPPDLHRLAPMSTDVGRVEDPQLCHEDSVFFLVTGITGH